MNILFLPLQLLAAALRPAPLGASPHTTAPPVLSSPAPSSSSQAAAAGVADAMPEDDALGEGCGGGDEEEPAAG